MSLRKIHLTVGGTVVGNAITHSYPVSDGKSYSIPTYSLSVDGTSSAGSPDFRVFEVIRFGVYKSSPNDPPHIVGLADAQTHVIRAWVSFYTVHSAQSVEKGAWQVMGNFLIHDGPDKPHTQSYATAGCVEVTGGPFGFERFNDYLISLSGSTKATRDEQLDEIGRSGIITVAYKRAPRPPLVEWSGPT